jgi:hypothetical protein
MSTSVSGHCLCGAISYEISADPVVTAVCHCDDCQRQSGSSFSVNMGVPRAALTVTGDTMKTFVTVGSDSHQPRDRNFCGTCGSPLFTVLSEMPELAFVKVGTLEDHSIVAPVIEVWCERAQRWVGSDAERGRFDRDMVA